MEQQQDQDAATPSYSNNAKQEQDQVTAKPSSSVTNVTAVETERPTAQQCRIDCNSIVMPWKQHWKQLLLLASGDGDGNSQLDVKSNYPLPVTANSTIISPVMQGLQQKVVRVTTNPA